MFGSPASVHFSDATGMQAAIVRFAQEQQRAIENLESSLPSPAAFASLMERFADDAAGIAALADSSHRASAPAPITLIIDETDRRGASHAIYDQFFHVTRIQGLSADDAAAAVLSAYANVLLDLPYSTIARAETLYLLRAMARSLALIGSGDGDAPDNVIPFARSHGSTGMARTLEMAWAGGDADPEWMTRVADHRWLSGHHLFFLFANFCRVSLDGAVRALDAGDHDQVASCLLDAGLFQRALASAMWYAGDFPPALYRSHTRPWMSTAGAANGFSGSDNIDYADLHKSRGAAMNALFSAFGSSSEAWPVQVEHAIRSFHEMEIQHAEHHVQVAARMVGTDTSLVQKQMTRAVYNAVDVLRDMVSEAWTDFDRRFS
jgi:hypothetical protein